MDGSRAAVSDIRVLQGRYAYGPTWMYGAHRLGFRR